LFDQYIQANNSGQRIAATPKRATVDLIATVKTYFGDDQFRPLQEEIIKSRRESQKRRQTPAICEAHSHRSFPQAEAMAAPMNSHSSYSFVIRRAKGKITVDRTYGDSR
jgi:hypothetical protein